MGLGHQSQYNSAAPSSQVQITQEQVELLQSQSNLLLVKYCTDGHVLHTVNSERLSYLWVAVERKASIQFSNINFASSYQTP